MEKIYIVFTQDQVLLIKKNNLWKLPVQADLIDLDIAHCFSIFDKDNREYIICQASGLMNTSNQVYFNLREVYALLGEFLFNLVGRARQILEWRINHVFCGKCGDQTEFFDQGRAKKCVTCGLVNYPKISPCMLVAVIRNDEILLAHHALSRQGIYTVLAGFVEPGERIEDTVHREVFEEVGLIIQNLRYIASQSWPFPNQLMCGFMAEYKSGEIEIDKNELIDAKWFHRNQMPSLLPPPMTLSFNLIQQFLEQAD